MYNEYLVSYERSNLVDEKFIELANKLGVNIDDNFIDDEIFHGEDIYIASDYGNGKIFIFINNNTEEILLVNTYLSHADQFAMMEIGVRCKQESAMLVKELLLQSFEEDRMKPITEKIRKYKNDTILNVSKLDKVGKSIFFDGQGKVDLIDVEVIRC